MIAIDPLEGLRLLYGGPVVLVATRHDIRGNFAPVSWHCPLSQNPVLIGVALEPSSCSCHNIETSGEFALSIPHFELLPEIGWCGRNSGRRVDKLRLLELPTEGARMTNPLLPGGCLGHLECVVQSIHRMGDHRFFVGEVVCAQVDPESFQQGWKPDCGVIRHLGGNRYLIGGQELVDPRWQPDPQPRWVEPLFPDSED